MVDKNTQNQLMYEEGVIRVRDSIREMKAEGADFSKKENRKKFITQLIDTTKKIAHDKRIWD